MICTSLAASLTIGLFAVVSAFPTGVYVGDKGEVGASWGGYSASAGLGGLLGGPGGPKGGLHAEAGTPGGQFAAAGLGGQVGGANGSPAGGVYGVASSGSSASSGASSSSSSGSSSHSNGGFGASSGHKGSFFDNIFNIPQSVLKSVNELLNKRVGESHNRPIGHGTKSHASASSSASAASSASSSGSSVASDNSVHTNQPAAVGGPTKYDQIFAIPQSALAAVAKLLNGL